MTAGDAGGVLTEPIDLRAAVNAISDVVQNRPPPLRDFDQIFMRVGDMVLQSEFIARWAEGRSVAFVGDGDAISVAVAYLRAEEILDYGPSRVVVFDFDERIVSSINSFARDKQIDWLEARLYNCLDPIPGGEVFECFYSNPPWGASNGGESVMVFAQRGMEFVGHQGKGLLVLADRNENHGWTETVLSNVQRFAIRHGFYIGGMMPALHSYHLDDDPELLSCNLILRAQPGNLPPGPSEAITDEARLGNFYKKGGGVPTVKYVHAAINDPAEPTFEYFDGGGA